MTQINLYNVSAEKFCIKTLMWKIYIGAYEIGTLSDKTNPNL